MSAQNGFQRAARMNAGYNHMIRNSELDLNRSPPRETEDGEEGLSAPLPQQLTRIGIDVIEDEDDDIIETSPRDFAQAVAARRIPRRNITVRVVPTDQSRAIDNDHIGYRRILQNTPLMNSVNYISSEGCSNSMNGNASKLPEPPKKPIFKCPICMDALTEEMSTMCGHIFCKKCIGAAILAQGKCPTCRKVISLGELRRVFLPSAN